MRVMRFGLFVCVALVSVKPTPAAFAQDGTAPCSIGMVSLMGYGVAGRGTTPYTAKIKVTWEHRLSEGNAIHGFAYMTAARDSAGRNRSESGLQCYRGEDGKPELAKQVSVDDPKAHTFLHWQEGQLFGDLTERKATLMHPTGQPAAPPRPKPTAEELAARRKAVELRQPPQTEYKREDLGIRNIAGVEARGTRTTRTIPAGEEGNDLPLTVITEQWRSEELGLVVLGIQDDPRIGRSVQELEEVDKQEPVATLFAPPEGYKIVEFKPSVEVPVTPQQ